MTDHPAESAHQGPDHIVGQTQADPQEAAGGGAQVHPGALKYYREKGIAVQ